MAKISMVSQHRRDKKFPETEAQRRARVRESGAASVSHTLQVDGLDALPGALSLEPPELAVDDLIEALIPAEMTSPKEAPDSLDQISQETPETTIRLELSPEQSRIIEAIPHLVKTQGGHIRSLTFDPTESQDQHNIVLQFSLPGGNVPEMMSLKELCQQLKVGRRSVLRMIREKQLRCYRIGRHYRFATSDVKQYLQQRSSQ